MAINVLKDTVLDALINSVNNAYSQTVTAQNAAVDAKDAAETAQAAAETAKGLSEDYKDVAASYANYAGKWADLTGSLSIPAAVLHSGSFWMLLNNVADVTATEPDSGNADWKILNESAIAIVDNLTSQVTEGAALSPNQGRVLNEAKSEKETPTENVSGSDYTLVAGDLDKIKIMQSAHNFTVPKDVFAIGATIGLMKDQSGTVNVTFATNVSAIPSNLTSGFEITQVDQIVWIHQIRTNEWLVLGEDETLGNHLLDFDDPHKTKEIVSSTIGSNNTLWSGTEKDVIRSNASVTLTINGSLNRPMTLVQDGASNTITVTNGTGVTLVGSILSTTNDKDSLGILPIGNDTFLVFYRETPEND